MRGLCGLSYFFAKNFDIGIDIYVIWVYTHKCKEHRAPRPAVSGQKEIEMKKTDKIAALKQPHNHWINRRVWINDKNDECVKINGYVFEISWLMTKGWEVSITF